MLPSPLSGERNRPDKTIAVDFMHNVREGPRYQLCRNELTLVAAFSFIHRKRRLLMFC